MKFKKFAAAFAVAAMAALFAVTAAFAAGTGTIKITNATPGEAYTVYKVFEADGDGDGKISYKLVSGKDTAPTGFSVDTAGNVTYTGSGNNGQLTSDDISAIAAYVTNDDVVATAIPAENQTELVFDGLSNGYYYITTSMGTVVTVDSTNPNAEVTDKNVAPTIAKSVSDVTAQIGQTVTYTITVDAKKGAHNYVVTDILPAGLTLNDSSVTVKSGEQVIAYTKEYTASNNTLEITLTGIEGTSANKTITITYRALVNENAAVKNTNTVTLSYGAHQSISATCDVYTGHITVTKNDGDGNPLAGAGFVLKNADAKYYKYSDNVVSWVDDVNDATEYFSSADGTGINFNGLAAGSYTIVEKTVPAGYNKAADKTVRLTAGETTMVSSETVINNAGATLPTTGGMGTTIFYIIGALLVAGAVVVLVARRRVRE